MTLTRRSLLTGMGASLLLAPSIVRASSLDYVPREAPSKAAEINEEFRRMFVQWSLREDGIWVPGTVAHGSHGWAYLPSGVSPPPSLKAT